MDLPLTFDLVLNPAIHLAWIQAQWETEYVQRSEDIILKIVSITWMNISLILLLCADGALPWLESVNSHHITKPLKRIHSSCHKYTTSNAV